MLHMHAVFVEFGFTRQETQNKSRINDTADGATALFELKKEE